MRFPIRLLLLLVLPLASTAQQRPWVEAITYEAALDSPFSLGGDTKIYQYHNDGLGVTYRGDRPALHGALRTATAILEFDKSFDGLVRVRFVVNKAGESGMFRAYAYTIAGEVANWPPASLHQLTLAVKHVNGWQPKIINDQPVHYYQYVLFRIQGGKISQILP